MKPAGRASRYDSDRSVAVDIAEGMDLAQMKITWALSLGDAGMKAIYSGNCEKICWTE
jgi:hypothetical protein